MASFALIALPPSLLMTSAAKDQKKGLFDFLSDALDKKSLVETDPVLQPGDGKPGVRPKPSPAGKKPAPKKQGGGFFGKK